jgi:hypothetical protein
MVSVSAGSIVGGTDVYVAVGADVGSWPYVGVTSDCEYCGISVGKLLVADTEILIFVGVIVVSRMVFPDKVLVISELVYVACGVYEGCGV